MLKQFAIYRPWTYPFVLGCFYISWFYAVFDKDIVGLFFQYWPIPLTMFFGSFFAGSTPIGGAAVAFPIFTKVLNIATQDARTFGLMIQSVGMTMASIFIFSRSIHVRKRVIVCASVGGILGMIVGAFYVQIPYTKVLFSCFVTLFGIVFAYSHWKGKHVPQTGIVLWDFTVYCKMVLAGFFGGLISSATGAGVGMLIFVVMVLAYKIHEKICVPTVIFIMTIVSLTGFSIHALFLNDIRETVWNYWILASPVVAVGAPLGAFVSSRVSRRWIVIGTLFFIIIDFLSTLYLVVL